MRDTSFCNQKNVHKPVESGVMLGYTYLRVLVELLVEEIAVAGERLSPDATNGLIYVNIHLQQ